MIQDLHSHTYYSFCGADKPEAIVEAAIAGGIELFGICDHSHGAAYGRFDVYNLSEDVFPRKYDKRSMERYFDHINLVKEKYADRITVLRGVEVATLWDSEHSKWCLPDDADVSMFDYCLIEHLDHPNSITNGDLFSFAERCGCKVTGVAHTDLFAHAKKMGEDPYRYFCRMAEQGIFWEMNVSYDSTHSYREHQYMIDFFADKEKQAIVRESGVRLSVGFDGHRVKDYLPGRVADYCRRVTNMGIRLVYED